MNQTIRGSLRVLLLLLLSTGLAHAAACGGLDTRGKPSPACLAAEVQAVDAQVSMLYQSLLKKSPAAAKRRIEASQRTFIKDRDAACLLDSSAMSRAQWLARIQQRGNLRLCEMRYLHARAGQLQTLLAALGKGPPQQVLGAGRLKFRMVGEDYQLMSRNAHDHGRWYMEVTVNGAALAPKKNAPFTAIQLRCANPSAEQGSYWTVYAGAHDRHGPAVYRLALDLDRGRVYFARNGRWLNGRPGAPGGGTRFRKGQYGVCGVVSSQSMADLLARKAVAVNFGERPFAYHPPRSFKPFYAKPRWIDRKTLGMTVSLDYNAIDLRDAKPSILVRNVFDAPQAIEDGYRYRTEYAQFEVDCGARTFTQRLTGMAPGPDADYAASANMQPGKPLALAAQPADSIAANAAKTICFLKRHGFAKPRLDRAGKWESMHSPLKGINIFEAPDRRVYRNGDILVKMKNDFSSDVASFGGKAGTTHVGYFAVACKEHKAHSLFVAGYDARGHLEGGSFYNASDAMPKLPENRKRYEDACRAYLSNPMAYEKQDAPHLAAARVHAAHPPAHRRAAVRKRKPVRHVRRAHHHARRARRVAGPDKDLRYCLDKPTNEAIIACTEKGERAAR